jgi:hypothetical protein
MQKPEYSKVIATRVTPDMAAEIEKFAAAEFLPVAALVRRVLAIAMQGRRAA